MEAAWTRYSKFRSLVPCRHWSDTSIFSPGPSASPFFKNQKGQGLIQVLISVAIMSVVTMAFASMISGQIRETEALSQKVAALDLQKLVTSALADGSVCTYVVKKLSNPQFDSGLISATSSPPAIDLGSTLPASGTTSAPAIVTVGNSASPLSSSTIVKSIQLTNIKCPPPCPSPVLSNQFTANVQVNFDGKKLVRAILPVASQTILQTTNAGGNMKKIIGCKAGGGGGSCPSGQFMIGINSDGSPHCTTPSGAPCTITYPNGPHTGVTSVDPVYGKCCLIGSYVPSGPITGGNKWVTQCVPF